MRAPNAWQRFLLDEIAVLGPITTAALARHTGETVSATRSALKRLEARGLVEPERYGQRAVVWMLREEER